MPAAAPEFFYRIAPKLAYIVGHRSTPYSTEMHVLLHIDGLLPVYAAYIFMPKRDIVPGDVKS